jgi:hypothetical protein
VFDEKVVLLGMGDIFVDSALAHETGLCLEAETNCGLELEQH